MTGIYRKAGLEANIDNSINSTLNRTIMTSLTTLVVMIPLCIMVSVFHQGIYNPSDGRYNRWMLFVYIRMQPSLLSILCKSGEESKYTKQVIKQTKQIEKK